MASPTVARLLSPDNDPKLVFLYFVFGLPFRIKASILLNTPLKRSMATTFPRFNYLPKEIRLQIWVQALPGPRIVYIERYLNSAENTSAEWSQDDYPAPTHFASKTPNGDILSLLSACQGMFVLCCVPLSGKMMEYTVEFEGGANGDPESRVVVKQNYECILSKTNTWFDFEHDFLYVDWGWSYNVKYRPGHFTPSCEWDPEAEEYAPPFIAEDVARKVKNLVTNHLKHEHHLERWLVKDVLGIFVNVELLVLADQLHNSSESGEELVWLRGNLGLEVADDYQMAEAEAEQLRNLIFWKNSSRFKLCANFDKQKINDEWNRYLPGRGPETMKIVKKIVTTAGVKKRLLDICVTENGLKGLKSLDWQFVTEDQPYRGDLALSQQIAYLKLAIDRFTDPKLKTYLQILGNRTRGVHHYEIMALEKKINLLTAELEMEKLVGCEAESTV